MFCVCARALDDRINSGKEERTIVAPRPVVVYLLRSHTRTHAHTHTCTCTHVHTRLHTFLRTRFATHTGGPFLFYFIFFHFPSLSTVFTITQNYNNRS